MIKDVSFNVGVTANWTAGTARCSGISCHAGTDAVWGGTACLDCHSIPRGGREAVKPLLSGNSHNIRGVQATDIYCYQCHKEANSDGTINVMYHGGSVSPGSAVDLR
jgi:hypothetical protein